MTNYELIAENERLREALKMQMYWVMRDGTPCGCPAGANEDERKGKMPTAHTTACEMARKALERKST
jgi:hypothetical protein